MSNNEEAVAEATMDVNHDTVEKLSFLERIRRRKAYWAGSTIPWWFPWPNKHFTLYGKEWTSYQDWEIPFEDPGCTPEVQINFYINRHSGFHFSVQVNGYSHGGRNPIRLVVKQLRRLANIDASLDALKGECRRGQNPY